MDLIKWQDSFNTGESSIDMQHRTMVQLINDLFNTLGIQNTESKMEKIFTELYSYILYHFSLEETILQKSNYPDFDEHKKDHHDFVGKITDFKVKYLAGDAKINVTLLNFLKNWLIDHILEKDKIAIAYVQKNPD